MVRMTELKKAGNTASCRYFPENENMHGMVHISLDTGEIEKIEHASDNDMVYAAHASSKLYKLCNTNDPLPDEAFSIWY